VPGLVVQVHLDQHIAREELALALHFRTAAHLDDFLDRDHDLLDPLREALLLGLVADRLRHLLLEARIDVEHVPARRHGISLRIRG
jgi:hypothetical protein